MALLQALNILLLASMLVLGSAAEAPSGYRIDLIHVDANGGFTREELIRRAVDRTDHRAAMLSAAVDGTNSPASSGTYPLKYSDYEYLMKLEIGTSRKDFWAVADTGSDYIWTKELDHCMFTQKYGSGAAIIMGLMANEKLTFSRKTTDKLVAFGCAIYHSDGLLPEGAHGIVGLNRGPMSLFTQLDVKKFSYCLSNQREPQLISRLWFGDGDDLGLSTGGKSSSSSQTMTTNLVQVSMEPPSVLLDKYLVELEGISIGSNKKYKSIEKNYFRYTSTNGNGVMMLDTGSPRTNLESSVFQILKDLLAQELHVDVPKSEGKKTCFRAKPSEAEMAEMVMVLYFTNEAQMRLPWENYMDHEEEGLFCLAFREASVSVLGNFQQQNTSMQYDLNKGELKFVQNVDCSQ